MGEKPNDERSEPTLELPPLFGRKRKSKARIDPRPVEVEPDQAEPVEAEPDQAEPDQAEPDQAEPVQAEADQDRTTVTAPAPPKRPKRTGPLLPAPLAALATGLLVGLVGTALTWVSLRGCESVRGTDSCGGGPGFGLLVLIVVVMVLLGAALLRLLGLSEAGGTSFLAIGLLCVVVLVTLMEELFSVWMFLAVPLISAATYALGHWITTRFVESTDPGPGPDVR
jgi:hypothetical protein